MMVVSVCLGPVEGYCTGSRQIFEIYVAAVTATKSTLHFRSTDPTIKTTAEHRRAAGAVLVLVYFNSCEKGVPATPLPASPKSALLGVLLAKTASLPPPDLREPRCCVRVSEEETLNKRKCGVRTSLSRHGKA